MKVLKTIGYWFASCTWGIIMTLFGAIIALSLLITGHKPHVFHYSVYFEFGKGGWGFEAGPFFFSTPGSSRSLKAHEHGHGLQNIVLGPLMPLVVSIPSMLRFWYREQKDKQKRIIYSVISTIILLAIGVPFIVCGLLYCKWLFIPWILWTAYSLWIGLVWQLSELPKYENSYPDYDEFFVEANATYLGNKYFN